MTLEPGAQIGDYRIETPIGRGGMGVVCAATDERLGRQVALKVLATDLASEPAFRDRFVRESRIAASLDDPHVIPIYEAGESDGQLFIAMRLVPGGRDLGRPHGAVSGQPAGGARRNAA